MRARASAVLSLLLISSTSAYAGGNDLTLERIVGPPASPGAVNDPTDAVRQSEYRSLMSELGVVMAPSLMTPADTLGWSGFQLSFDTSFTQISSQQDFWQKGVSHVSSGFLPTISVMARKGIWLPFPSMEIGVGAKKLMDSNLLSLVAYARVAVQEGYQGWALPSIALGAAVSRLMGTSQVDMTVLSADATVSKSFGIAGTLRIEPFIAANLLVNFIRGQVIDSTPDVDALGGGPGAPDLNEDVTFPDPPALLRWRLGTGFRLVYSIVELTAEFDYTLCNDSGISCGTGDPGRPTDRSGGQAQVTFGAGLIF